MEFYFQMYFGRKLKDKKARIIRKLKENRLQPGLYVIALAQNGQDQLEFFSSLLLKQEIFHAEDLFVVGVASGYQGALELTEQIVEDVCLHAGRTDIRNYILEEQTAYKEGKRTT